MVLIVNFSLISVGRPRCTSVSRFCSHVRKTSLNSDAKLKLIFTLLKRVRGIIIFIYLKSVNKHMRRDHKYPKKNRTHKPYKKSRRNSHNRKTFKSSNQKFNFSKIFNLKLVYVVELPLVLLSLFILISSLFSFGLFIFPIFAIAIAGGIIRWITPSAQGFMFVYHTLALSGGFLLFIIIMLYQMLSPLFQMF